MRFPIRQILTAVVVVCAWGGTGAVAQTTEAPFHRGVNLTTWLQVGSARQIQFTRFTKQDLIHIKSLGCDVIRLPINLHSMAGGAPNYTVDPLFFYLLDQIVDWCEELEIHLILDIHTPDPDFSADPDLGRPLVPIWTQMAAHCKNRSAYLCYEVLNEPHGITDARRAQIQQQVVTAIRAAGAYCIRCTGFARYNAIAFDFRPDKDLKTLVQMGYLLDFRVRGDTPGARFDVRFLDTKITSPQDHPWRMTATIDERYGAWNGPWRHVQIPLQTFVDRGSWDGVWLTPQGLFDWSVVDRFEIVSAYHAFVGMQFWFDNMRIMKPSGTR